MGKLAPKQPVRFERDQSLCRHILHELPPVLIEPERMAGCSPESLEQTACRILAQYREWAEFWKVEVTG